jgi:hypothetical protein
MANDPAAGTSSTVSDGTQYGPVLARPGRLGPGRTADLKVRRSISVRYVSLGEYRTLDKTEPGDQYS